MPRTFLTPIQMSSNKIEGLATGTAATDAVNKAQLDAVIATQSNLFNANQSQNSNRVHNAQGYDFEVNDTNSFSWDYKYGSFQTSVANAEFSNSFGASGYSGTWDGRGHSGKWGFGAGGNVKVYGYGSAGLNINTIADGLIALATGNGSVASSNDGEAMGNRTIAGRKVWSVTSTGIDNSGTVGNRPYFIIADSEGDLRPYFPNPAYNALSAGAIASMYASGTTVDVNGNVFPSGITDLHFAMHPYIIIRGLVGEANFAFFKLVNCVYTPGVGTKVWFEGVDGSTTMPYSGSFYLVTSSTAPTVSIFGDTDLRCGNGAHTEGVQTSAWGYGAHAEGFQTKAYGDQTHAGGANSFALSKYAFVHGNNSKALGLGDFVVGSSNSANGNYNFIGGAVSTTTGLYNMVWGSEIVNTGNYAAVFGIRNSNIGESTLISGAGGLAARYAETVHASGFFSVRGDAQSGEFAFRRFLPGAGWFGQLYFQFEPNGTYNLETMVTCVDTITGESAAYKIFSSVECGKEIEIEKTAIDVATDVFTKANHGFSNGNKVMIRSGIVYNNGTYGTGGTPGGTNNTTFYYIINATTNTFQLSTTVGGSAVNITSQGPINTYFISEFNVIKTIEGKDGKIMLISRTFTTGDGISSGVRISFQNNYHENASPTVRVDQLATSSIRWVFSTKYVKVWSGLGSNVGLSSTVNTSVNNGFVNDVDKSLLNSLQTSTSNLIPVSNGTYYTPTTYAALQPSLNYWTKNTNDLSYTLGSVLIGTATVDSWKARVFQPSASKALQVYHGQSNTDAGFQVTAQTTPILETFFRSTAGADGATTVELGATNVNTVIRNNIIEKATSIVKGTTNASGNAHTSGDVFWINNAWHISTGSGFETTLHIQLDKVATSSDQSNIIEIVGTVNDQLFRDYFILKFSTTTQTVVSGAMNVLSDVTVSAYLGTGSKPVLKIERPLENFAFAKISVNIGRGRFFTAGELTPRVVNCVINTGTNI